MKKAQVFISCGQRDEREKSYGEFLIKCFSKKGFETYFAEEIHNSKPLLQSIYESLKRSEYVVICNPFREENNIGSLFVQQELAIAAFSSKPILYFYNKKVDKTCGMSGVLHLNGIEVNTPQEMLEHLNKLTKTWDPMSVNQLFLNFGNEHLTVTINNYPQQPLSNWYHIIVHNKSKTENAINCRAYVESIKDNKGLSIFGSHQYRQEIIWAGTGKEVINITKDTKRDFDALFTVRNTGVWQFQSLQTSTVYAYPVLQNGTYYITFVVTSDNLPEAKIHIKILLQNDRAKLLEEKQL